MIEENINRIPRTILYLISLIKLGKNVFVISEFERSLGYLTPQPDLRKLIEYLISKDVIGLYDTVAGIKRYQVRIKKLKDMIDELPITNLYYEYFNQEHYCQW